MIRQLDRYVIGAIFGLTAVVALGLVTLYSFIGFITEIDQGSDRLSVRKIFEITVLLMPSGLYVLMPLVAMLGTLLGIGQLAAQSELTAMRAAGYSNLRIGRSAMIAGLLLGLIAVGLGESLAPAGERAAESIKSGARSSSVSRPVWLRDGSDVFFIRSLVAEDHFADADVYRLGQTLELVSMLHVSEAYHENGAWRFENVQRTEFSGSSTRVETLDAMEWTSGLTPEVLRLYVLESDNVSARGLMRLVRYLDDNGLDATEQRMQLWRKLLAPLTVMAMVLFAVPFVFGPTRGGGAGQRLLIGVLVGVSFHLFNEISASLGALYGWSAPIAAGLPTALLMMAATVRLVRAR
ncbi:MAG: LPS export ABC transporter permease LptG [Panacagrimonas sp.]